MKIKRLPIVVLLLLSIALCSCASVISFPERAVDPNVPIYGETEEEETVAPSDIASLLGIWYNEEYATVFKFGEDGVLTAWGLATGYDYEYSNMATGTYTYDGVTLSLSLQDETMTKLCSVTDGMMTLEGGIVLYLREDEPAEHPSYDYPDFEELAKSVTAPFTAEDLSGKTVTVENLDLLADVQMKSTYFKSHEPTELTTERATVLGDYVNIDYVGKLDGVAFEGGTATGSDVFVAPDTGYIDGFCEGIAGHQVGEIFDVTVTFPADYSATDLAGKAVVFTMTLNKIYDTSVTDEMVSADETTDYSTVAEWLTAIKKDLVTEDILSYFPILDNLVDTTSAYLYFYQNSLDYYHYYAYYYGVSYEDFLTRYVGITEDGLVADCKETARQYLLTACIVKVLNVTPSDEWLSDFTSDYIAYYKAQGYSEDKVRESISSGDGYRQFRAYMLSSLACERLYELNVFVN